MYPNRILKLDYNNKIIFTTFYLLEIEVEGKKNASGEKLSGLKGVCRVSRPISIESEIIKTELT